MKASYYISMPYRTEERLPAGWPLGPGHFDRDDGQASYRSGIEQVELADSLGFDWVSVSEHHYSNSSVAPHPAVMGAALLQHAPNARIAILGPTLPLNNPVRVAEELAMLDNLSGGRLVVGLSRGTPNEYQVFGANPAETRGRSLESMEIILRTWTEPEPFGWQGRFYEYRTISVWPRPLQEPHPPCYVLGTSAESADFAASNRLGIGMSYDNAEAFAPKVAYYRRKCLEAGWEPSADHVVLRATCYVAESDEEAMADTAEFGGRGGLRMGRSINAAVASVDPNPRDPTTGYGGPAQRPRINFLGSPETVYDQVRHYREVMGAGVVDLLFQAPQSHDKIMRSIELFGREVLPRISPL
jgi:alkanesulfonate monooxygenase SsuD/methylene tetrahydromethanopterin reductase-like flavin-dependent oxidoreductase (luciferase family)